MSSHPASAALTGALLANKGAAAPSNTVTAFLEEFPASATAPRGDLDDRPQVLSGKPSGTKTRAKLSVRLDPERHLRLKLAAAHLRRSSQTIMLEALDAYLGGLAPALGNNCACLKDDG